MIQYFSEIRKEDVMSVGGKGANLGEMAAAELFREKIREGKLPQTVSDGIAQACRKLAETCEEPNVRVALAAVIIKKYRFPEEPEK